MLALSFLILRHGKSWGFGQCCFSISIALIFSVILFEIVKRGTILTFHPDLFTNRKAFFIFYINIYRSNVLILIGLIDEIIRAGILALNFYILI